MVSSLAEALLCIERGKKNTARAIFNSNLAGMLGIEPRSTVLETAILAVVLHPFNVLRLFYHIFPTFHSFYGKIEM